jgi:Cu-Zn family superoxide dismutase
MIQLYGPNSVIGRAIVLHALPDDLGLQNNNGSLTTGNSGGRIGCGDIGYN